MPSSTFDSDRVIAFLNDPVVREIERDIAASVGLSVRLGHRDALVRLLVRDMQFNGWTPSLLEQIAREQKSLVIKFGGILLRGEARVPDREEWNSEEGNQQEDAKIGPTLGMSEGFALNYITYLWFLMSECHADLIAHLKCRRIPHAKGFHYRLRKYYASATAT